MKRFVTTTLFALLAASVAATPTDMPAHLKLAEKMVADIKPANNRYKSGAYTVTWAGVDGARITENASDCTTYVTALIKTAYHLSKADFEKLMGKSSPSISSYYESAVNSSGLKGFKDIASVKPGDLLISKYATASASGAAGHMMIVDSVPVKADTGSAGLQAYNITVIDCTGSPHASDTRVKPQSGVGRGTMQVYVDASGNVAEWSWSAGKRMLKYTAEDRPLIFAKVPH